jgi:acyl carrier protein
MRVGRETALREGLWLDSIELLEVVIACEEEFDFEFDERDLSPDALATAGTLAGLVARRLTSQSA